MLFTYKNNEIIISNLGIADLLATLSVKGILSIAMIKT